MHTWPTFGTARTGAADPQKGPSMYTSENSSWSSLASALLGRDEHPVYGRGARELIRGKRVLITGAAGSIGSELARQVDSLEPAELHLLDHDESRLHSLQLDLHGDGLFEHGDAILCDIRDAAAVRRAMQNAAPDIVFHVAAHKHLPLLERFPAEGIKTNILGSHNVITAAAAARAQYLVNVSTDKAAAPTSVLGATKRFAEMLVPAAGTQVPHTASVRFGNVLGSRGSFLRSLTAQTERGRPVTVTHPKVSRYFMTPAEAAGLIVEATALARSGETYVLDMGEPLRILDLAQRYFALLDAPRPDVVFTGLRPGEKLHEALFDAHDAAHSTSHPRISATAVPRPDTDRALAYTARLQAALAQGQGPAALRGQLLSMIEELCTSAQGTGGSTENLQVV